MTTPCYVIGLDPGDSTGLFIIIVGPSSAIRFRASQGDPTSQLELLEHRLEAARAQDADAHIACERYTVSARTGKLTQQSTPQRVIGRVETLAEKFDATFTLQSPGDAKAFCSNELLRRIGFWSKPSDVGCRDANDVNDAARHAVLMLAKTRASVFDRLISVDD